jgi:uncharacterized protein YjiS (DUF1127 family)
MTTTTQQTLSSIALTRVSRGSGAAWLYEGLATIHRGLQRQRQRRALLEFDDRMLEDIGISREQAVEEARKPFWK